MIEANKAAPRQVAPAEATGPPGTESADKATLRITITQTAETQPCTVYCNKVASDSDAVARDWDPRSLTIPAQHLIATH